MPNLWAINMHASKIRTLPPTGHDCVASSSLLRCASCAQEVERRAAVALDLRDVQVAAAETVLLLAARSGFCGPNFLG